MWKVVSGNIFMFYVVFGIQRDGKDGGVWADRQRYRENIIRGGSSFKRNGRT